ncbi:DgyrCDS7330 [Dimorphilus gyrociliatus]|uniref:DgyrCDS7330 n=1 Tax=Dimorphilus gyrociliatus TaxID=2664684 RepID=A0A7I8VSG6_9ANNE|nr:DgyrCDS7330 [Dimorphilus gyrociliatus]
MSTAGGKVDLKIVLLGKENSGKTSLVERYVYDRFAPKYQSTIGAAFGAKKITPKGSSKAYVAGIWDTAGAERYEAMSRIYYRGARAAIVCYDITDDTSFDRVKHWVRELRKNEENCLVYLCGCKKDLVHENKQIRKVDYHDVNDYADDIKAKLFETSSLLNDGVGELDLLGIFVLSLNKIIVYMYKFTFIYIIYYVHIPYLHA